MKKTIAFFLFFVITLTFLPAKPSRVSIGLQTTPELIVKKDPRYTTKVQPGISGEGRLNIDLAGKYFVQADIGYLSARPSGAGSDWVTYRGFSSFYFGGGFGFYFAPPSRINSTRGASSGFRPGIVASGFANYAAYNYTDIYFFFPTVEVEPFAVVARFFDGHIDARLGLPLSWNFQRDLDLFFSSGLSLSVFIYFPKL